MSWKDDALVRLAALIADDGKNVQYGTVQGHAHFIGWRAQALAALGGMLGEENVYVKQFIIHGNYDNGYYASIEILQRLRSDIENGYLQKTVNIISAEVFGDFLEIAGHLLEEGYKDPAASLTGAVLEDGLRRIARNSDIAVADRDDLTSLRDKCIAKKIFNNLVRQEITAWTTLRNSADHGKFDDYTAAQVSSMISGVRSFMAQHLQ